MRREEIPGRGTRKLRKKRLLIQEHSQEKAVRRVLGETHAFCLLLPQPLGQKPHDPKALICQPVGGSVLLSGRGRRQKRKGRNTEQRLGLVPPTHPEQLCLLTPLRPKLFNPALKELRPAGILPINPPLLFWS